MYEAVCHLEMFRWWRGGQGRAEGQVMMHIFSILDFIVLGLILLMIYIVLFYDFFSYNQTCNIKLRKIEPIIFNNLYLASCPTSAKHYHPQPRNILNPNTLNLKIPLKPHPLLSHPIPNPIIPQNRHQIGYILHPPIIQCICWWCNRCSY